MAALKSDEIKGKYFSKLLPTGCTAKIWTLQATHFKLKSTANGLVYVSLHLRDMLSTYHVAISVFKTFLDPMQDILALPEAW